MIDNTLINEALRAAWEGSAPTAWTDMESAEERARHMFFFRLSERIPARDPNRAVGLEDIVDDIREALHSVEIGRTKDGIILDIPGDTVGVSILKEGRVSFFSRQRKIGYNATTWASEDLAKAVATLADFESLSGPYREEFRKKVDEQKRRAQVRREFESDERSFLPSVYSALADNQDTGALRDEYIRMRKDFYAKLGDGCDDRMLENDWVDFKEYVQSILRNDRAREARENKARIKDKELEICSTTLEEILDRVCAAYRCTPFHQEHWDEYLVLLDDGQRVVFKDYSRETGSLNQAIIEIVPILEAFLPFASTKLSMNKRSPKGVEYSTSSRARYARAFKNQYGDDEIMTALQEKLKATRRPVLLVPGNRNVKLFCFFPHSAQRVLLSFTLKRRGGMDQVDDLVSNVKLLYSTCLKYWCFPNS